MKHRDVYYSMAILFLIGLVAYQCDSAKDNERNALENNSRLQTQIAERESRIKTADDSIHAIQAERILSDSLTKVSVMGYKSKIVVYQKTIKILRVEIKPVMDSIPAVGAFVALTDSVGIAKDSVITKLEGQIYDSGKSFEAELEQERGKFYEQVKNTEDWKQVAENATNLYEKIKRKKFSVGPNAGYGVSKDGLSPFVGVSIQYTIFRF